MVELPSSVATGHSVTSGAAVAVAGAGRGAFGIALENSRFRVV